MELIEVNCQTIGCKNKVKIIENHPYFGIFCEECWTRNSKTYTKSNTVIENGK